MQSVSAFWLYSKGDNSVLNYKLNPDKVVFILPGWTIIVNNCCSTSSLVRVFLSTVLSVSQSERGFVSCKRPFQRLEILLVMKWCPNTLSYHSICVVLETLILQYVILHCDYKLYNYICNFTTE